MSRKQDILIYPTETGDRWCVKKEGNKRPSYSFDTREEAERKGKVLAKEKQSDMKVFDSQDTLMKKMNFNRRRGQINYHVLKQDDHWIVRAGDRKQAKHKFKNKKLALKEARKAARDHSAMLVIHNPNGAVEKMQDLRGIPAPPTR
jgi:predicted secreted protein